MLLALGLIYGIGLLWLAWELHNAPVIPDEAFEGAFDAIERRDNPDALAVRPFHHAAASAPKGQRDHGR